MSDNLKIKLDIQFHDTAQTLQVKLDRLLTQMKNKSIDISVDRAKIDSEFNRIKVQYDSIIKQINNNEIKPNVDTKNTGIDKANSQFNSLESSVKKSGDAIKNTTQHTMSLKDAIGQAVVKFPLWFGISTIFVGLVHSIKDGISAVVDYDNQLTTLKFTMDGTEQQFQNMGSAAHQFAKDLGATVDNVMIGMQIYTNLNETIDSILEKSKASAVLSNLTGNDMSKSADALQGLIYQFDLTSDSAMHLVDVMTKLGADTGMEFSRSIQSMTDSIARGGSVAAEAGLSAEQYLSIISTITEKSRLTGSTVSAGLSTVFSRITRVSELAEEEVSKIEKAYKEIGIAIRDSNGEFEDMWTILQRLEGVWGTLNSTQRSYIGELSAGVRQKKIFLTLMNNMGTITDRATESMEANNFAMERNDIFLESIQGKLNKLSTIKMETWRNLIDSNDIKMSIDLLIKLSEGIGSVSNKTGMLGTTLGVVFGAMAMFGKNMNIMMTTSFTRFHTEWFKLNQQTMLMNGNLNGSIPLVTKMSNGVKALGISFDTSKIAAIGLNMAIGMGMGFAISKVIGLINDFVKAEENRRNAIIESAKEIQAQGNEIRQIEELIAKKEKLDKIEDKNKETKDELVQIQRQIANLLPETTSGYDKENQAISENIDLVKQRNEAKREALILQAQEIIALAGGTVDDEKSKLEALLKNQEHYLRRMKELQSKDTNDPAIQLALKAVGENLSELSKEIDKVKKEIFAFENAQKVVDDVMKSTNKTIEDQDESFENLTKSIIDHKKELELATESYEKITDKIQQYNKILQEMNSKEGLSGSTKDEIIRKHQELIPYLNNEGELRKQLIKIIQEEEKVQRVAYEKMISNSEEFFNSKIKGNKILVDKLGEYYSKDLENVKTLASAKSKVESNLIKELSEKWGRYFNAVSGTFEGVHMDGLVYSAMRGDANANKVLQEMQKEKDRFKDIESKFNSITADFSSGVDFSSINLSGNKKEKEDKTKEILDKIFSSFPAYKEQVADLSKSIETLSKEMSSLENEIKIAESLGQTEKAIKLQEQLIAKRAEERDLLHQTANALRSLQSQIEKDFANKFKLDIANLTEVDIKKFNDTLDRQVNDLQNKLAKTTTDSAKNAIQSQIDTLGQDKSMFSFLIDSFKSAGSEIEKLGGNWISSFLGEQSETKDNVGKKLTEMFKSLDETLLSSKQKLEDLNYELKMLDSDDTSGKIQNISDRLSVTKDMVSLTEKEFQRLNSTTPDSIKTTDEFKKKMDELTKSLKDSKYELKSLNDELEQTVYDMQKAILQGEKQNIEMEFEIKANNLKTELDKMQKELDKNVLKIELEIKDTEAVIKAIEETEKARKEQEERGKRLTEINKLENKLYYMKQIQAGTLTDELAKQVGLEKEKEEYDKKQIKLQELQLKLQNLQNEKNIQQLKKQEDGTFEYEYVADQQAIESTMKEIKDTQTDFEDWQKDNIDKLYEDLIDKRQSYDEWERQNVLQKHLDMLRLQVQNGQQRIAKLKEEFATEKQERETKLALEKEQALLHFRDMEVLTSTHLTTLKTEYNNQWTEISGNLETKFNKIKSDYLAMLAVLSTPISTGAGGVSMPTMSAPKKHDGGFIDGVNKFHSGGRVGDGKRDLPEMVNKLFNAKPNEQIVKALHGELFIPEKNIFKNFVPNMQNLISSMSSTPSLVGAGDTQQVFNISKLEFPNVKDGQDVLDTLQNLSTFVTQKIKKK